MRHFLFLLFLLPFTAFAQPQNQGVVKYEQLIEINIDLSKIPEGMGDMAKLIPKEQRYMKQLSFNASASLFVAVEEEDEEIATEGPGTRMRMWMERSEDQIYTDLKKNQIVEKKDFFGRTFLIKDSPEKLGWKMTGEQKEILGYPCMKATVEKDSVPMEAWFTPSIPVSTGPETMGMQLPGLVLEMSILPKGNSRQGKVTYTATSVTLDKVNKSDLSEPKKGKEVTREEFKAIVKTKIKEMQEQMGGKGGRGPRMHIVH